MSDRGKKIFLAICIITPFLLYTVYYYSIMVKNDLLYLHRKAAELGFWNFPTELKGDSESAKGRNTPTYYIEFRYKDKSKHVLYDISYEKEPKLADAAKSLITEISNMISDVRDRNKD